MNLLIESLGWISWLYWVGWNIHFQTLREEATEATKWEARDGSETGL